MKIRRRSWHYRLNMLFEVREPYNDTLCGYFWRIVFKLFILTFFGLLFTLFIALYFIDPAVAFTFNVIFFIVASVFIPAFTILYLRYLFDEQPTPKNEDDIMDGVDIIVEYLEAKKRKICPYIEYVD